MALTNKRIIDLPERASLNDDDYTVVDGANGGTGKYKLSQLQEDIGDVEQTVTDHGTRLTTAEQNIETNTADITDLKEDLNRLDDLSYGISTDGVPVEWFERGSITNGNNDTYRSGSRARTKNMLSFDSMVALTVTTGQFVVTYYNDNGTYKSNTGWKTTTDTIVIQKNQKFRFMVTLNNGAPASQTDAMVDMVASVVFKLDAIEKRTKYALNMEFEHGSLERGTDNTYFAAGRCRTTKICEFPYDLIVSMTSGSYGVHFFDSSGVYTNQTAWRTTEKYRIKAYTKFRLILTADPNSGNYADLSDMVDNLNIEIGQNNMPASACPNIIWQCRNVDDTKIPPESKWYIRAAANNQYDRVRCTVRKTTEGYYFMCHDDYINNVARNSDGTAISSQIAANGRTLAELNTYDWGIKYGSEYAGAHVPMLEDFLKYAALFNLGVTWHSATSLVETDADISNICEMFDQYGLTDNMIVISASGQNFDVMQKFKNHNPRISYYVGGEESWFTENLASIKNLQTNYNKIYVQLYPWNTVPTTSFIEFAKTNNFVLYDSIAMNESKLLDVDTFNKGYGLREVNNVYMIKDTVRNWANGLI